MNRTNLTVLIPARLGSSRLPNKPLADVGGLPLIVRVAQRVMAGTTARVVVALVIFLKPLVIFLVVVASVAVVVNVVGLTYNTPLN